MSYLPILRRKHQNKFTNPLTGMIYDNKKYTQSCFVDPELAQNQMLSLHNKSKSIPHSFFKAEPSQNKVSQLGELQSEKFMKTAKLFNLSKRLSNHQKPPCSRSKLAVLDKQEFPYRQTSVNKQRIVNAIVSSKEGLSVDLSSQLKAYKYSEIDVLVLDLFVNASDIDKRFKLSLKRYFEMFFKEKLPGIVFKELVDLLEKYIEIMVIEDIISEDYQQNEGNNDPVTIFSKKGLYMKILELQKSGKDSEIYELIQRYCLPNSSIRAVFLQDIINLISIQLFQTYNQSKDNEYVLLNSKGIIIKDFAQIKFSTKSLFVSEKSKAEENYLRYLYVIKNNSRLKSKTTFRQTLRQDFRNNVVQGNFEESPTSDRSPKEELSENKRNILKAESLVSTRNDKTNCTRTKFRQFLLRSGSSKKERTISSNSEKKTDKPNSSEYYSINDKIVQQYKFLRMENDYSENSLKNDEVNREKIHLEILTLHCVYFKTKTLQQRNKILYSLQFIEKDEDFESYKRKMIDLDQYNRMRNIINCLGPKETIIHFIDRYLGYDEYGEINKIEMKEKLTMAIGVQGKTSDVILQIIWLWLERNGVIVNEILRRDNMTSMYEKNKLVYYFLISLIFGTNQTTAIELAQEILI